MKTINSMLPFTALEEIEKQSKSCWEQLNIPGAIHKSSQLRSDMPVFLITGSKPLLYVYFPTYRVDILLPENNKSYDKEIELLLKDISYRSRLQLSALDYAIIHSRYLPVSCPARFCTTTCLGADLRENAAICSEITDVLDRERIQYAVLPVYRYKTLEIRFLEDGDSFVVL